MKIKLILEYEGGAFSGWQWQPGQNTVQGALEKALVVYCRSLKKKRDVRVDCRNFEADRAQHQNDHSESDAERIVITGSGRTDAGVHARGQVASFSWPESLQFEGAPLLGALNALTPRELTVLDAAVVPDDFDARFSPHIKEYRYTLLLRRFGDGLYRKRAWRVGRALSLPAMIDAARIFKGTHDFAAFRSSDCNAKTTVRTLHLSEISRPSADLAVYVVQGPGFLKQMIRSIVGGLVEVGRGRMAPETLSAALAAGDRRLLTSQTAPAHGLELSWVRYRE